MANNYKRDKRGGYYWRDGKPFISVTTVLNILDKPELRYWVGKQVYLAMVADPTLSWEDAYKSVYAVSDKAKNRGTTVHSIIEAYKTTSRRMAIENLEFGHYAENFYTWIDHVKPSILEQERSVFSSEHNYAGTLDMFARIGDNTYVIDIKTGKGIYNEAYLQTAAYRLALIQESIKVDGVAVLLLPPKGTYQFHVIDNLHELDVLTEGFLAAKKMYEAKNYEDLQKVGYFNA